jgi:hypothetical protein
VDHGETSERPAVLEYGRPPPSRMASVSTRVGIFFVLGVVFFGCAILGGYVGHLAAPGPMYSMTWVVQLPDGTTAASSPEVANVMERMKREEVIATVLRAAKVDGGETPAQLAEREMVSFSPAMSNSSGALILVAFADRNSQRSATATRALAAELDSILTSQNQTHFARPLPALSKVTQGSAEFWLVGGGVVVGLLVPAVGLRMLWKPFSRIAASAAMSEAVWTQGPR